MSALRSKKAVWLRGSRGDVSMPPMTEENRISLLLDDARRAHDNKAYACDYVVRHGCVA